MMKLRLNRSDGMVVIIPADWIEEFEAVEEGTEILFKSGDTMVVEEDVSWIYNELNDAEALNG